MAQTIEVTPFIKFRLTSGIKMVRNFNCRRSKASGTRPKPLMGKLKPKTRSTGTISGVLKNTATDGASTHARPNENNPRIILATNAALAASSSLSLRAISESFIPAEFRISRY